MVFSGCEPGFHACSFEDNFLCYSGVVESGLLCGNVVVFFGQARDFVVCESEGDCGAMMVIVVMLPVSSCNFAFCEYVVVKLE